MKESKLPLIALVIFALLCFVAAVFAQTTVLDIEISVGALKSKPATITIDRGITIQWVLRKADAGDIQRVIEYYEEDVDPDVPTNEWWTNNGDAWQGNEVFSAGFVVAYTNSRMIVDPDMIVDTNASQNAQNQALLNHFTYLLLQSAEVRANLDEKTLELEDRAAADRVEVRGRDMIEGVAIP